MQHIEIKKLSILENDHGARLCSYSEKLFRRDISKAVLVVLVPNLEIDFYNSVYF